jgi:N,N'-diacetyl-8-epilegionaminate cytidylyltransferase
MTPYVVGAIFARGGSKGVPRKNIRQLGGKPLIAHAIGIGLASKMINRLVVSTEDEEIAHVARQWGAEVPFLRPQELARDDSPELLSWRHLLESLQAPPSAPRIEVLVSLPATSPLRSVEDVENCIRMLLESDADVVVAVKSAERNPYFDMVVLDEQNYVRPVLEPDKPIYRRQDAPAVFDITTVAYAARPGFLVNAKSIFDGKVKGVLVPTERAVDIDTELDFKFAEFMFSQKLQGPA